MSARFLTQVEGRMELSSAVRDRVWAFFSFVCHLSIQDERQEDYWELDATV